MQAAQEFQNASAEDIANRYIQKHREKKGDGKGAAAVSGGVATIETARLMRERPRTEDPKLFLVKCKPGEENPVVQSRHVRQVPQNWWVESPQPQCCLSAR